MYRTATVAGATALLAAAMPYADRAHAQSQQSTTSNAFNPALSLILDGKYTNYSLDPAQYGISGFLLDDEAGLVPEGFSLGETELVASANVDDKFYGQVTLSIASTVEQETEVEIEEAFVQTTTLPAGLTARAGRFFSDIGYLNSKHAHTWDFTDQPLVYKALFGVQFGDDGVQVRWVAPTTLFIELGAEAFRGEHFPAAGAANGGVGAWTTFAHVGGDIGTTQSWRAGVSYLNADAEERESALVGGDILAFTGSSDIWGADVVWKWADHGNPRSRNAIVQAEYFHRREDGDLAVGGSPAIANYRGTQDGYYVQGVYQFRPRWRVGIRYDRLSADNDVGPLPIATPLTDAHDPSRITGMIDFSNSEFSRFRMQVSEDKSQPRSDTVFGLQYVFSLGAHGAHQF
jgi:hypothetical protein